MVDSITQGKTFTDLQSLNQIDGSSLFAVHLSGETYKMTYNQLLAQITGDLSFGAFDEIGTRFFSDRRAAPAGCLNCMDGAIYTNADTVYPEFWQKILEKKIKYITFTEYENQLNRVFSQNLTGVCGYVAVDLEGKRFRMPTYPNARVVMQIGTDDLFYDGQIINLTGTFVDDNAFNYRSSNTDGIFSKTTGGGQYYTDDTGRHGQVGSQTISFDASRQVKTGDQIRVPSTTHCLYMVVSTIRYELTTVYALDSNLQNEIVNRQNADTQINNAIAAINDKIEGALTTYYENTYQELQNFVLNNSAILKIGNVLICGGATSGEPVRQFLWNGRQMVETSTNVSLDNYYNKQQVDNFINNKVDKIDGKGLSTNDYTNAEKVRLSQSVLEPEYSAFKENTNTKIDNLDQKVDTEIQNRINNDIIDGRTEGIEETSSIQPRLFLIKENNEEIPISLDVLNLYLNTHSSGNNGTIEINNTDGEGLEDLGSLSIKEIKTSDNSVSLIKTHRATNDPVRLEFSLYNSTSSNDSVRLTLLNNGNNKRLYLLKDKGSVPSSIEEIDSNDEVLNKGEIINSINNIVSQAISGVLPIPTVISKESELPDISQGAKEVYYFVVENMDITSPTLLRQGRVWCGIGDTEWNKIIDVVNTLSENSFKQDSDGTWDLNDSTRSLIDNSVQSSQILITEPSSNDENNQLTSAKANYKALEKKVDKASIITVEPTEENTNEQIVGAKVIKDFLGSTTASLNTNSKTVVDSINELNTGKASISLDNLNQAGIERVAKLAAGASQNNLGQIIYSILPINDIKLHLANGEVIGQTGEYEKFNQYLHEMLTLHPNLFCTQTEWDESVNTYGQCVKFVIDDEAGTIRLPLLKGYIKGVNNITDLGTINQAELPNITGTFRDIEGDDSSGPFTASHGEYIPAVAGGTAPIGDIKTMNLSLANPIYKDGATVQPEGFNGLLYIVVGTVNQTGYEVIENVQSYNTVPLGTPLYLDHQVEDINYILSDNTWKDGLMYQSLYELLLSQYNSGLNGTKQFGEYSINFRITPLDYNIVLLDETNTEELINNIYDKYSSTFWVLDATNNRFKVPQNKSRTLVESWREGASWYNLYSDGWLEQGGYSLASNSGTTINLFKRFARINYSVFTTGHDSTTTAKSVNVSKDDNTLDSIKLIGWASDSYCFWRACGYGSSSYRINLINPNNSNYSKYLYYKAGNAVVNVDLINTNRLINQVENIKNGSGVEFNNLSNEAKDNLRRINIPDYSRAISYVANTPVLGPGFMIIDSWGQGINNGGDWVEINGIRFVYTSGYGTDSYVIFGDGVMVPVYTGDRVRCSKGGIRFVPSRD